MTTTEENENAAPGKPAGRFSCWIAHICSVAILSRKNALSLQKQNRRICFWPHELTNR